MTNDVLTPEFESKLDPMFRSDWKPKKTHRERKKTFNSRLLGLGMMPPVRSGKNKESKYHANEAD